ncbi:MAG: hypothetical protein FWE57_02100 [Chitinispirillia bacterium]|nr:hypothetical protein [Chitinispirillia bacterium]
MNRSKKLLALFTAGAAMLLSSCGDNIVENYERSINTEAALNIVVRDGATGNIINDADVTLLTAPTIKGAASSEKGTVTFEGVRVGVNHTVLIEKEDYTNRVVGGIQIYAPGGSTYIADDNTQIVEIYPLTAGLTGHLFFNDKDGVKQPAEGAKVRLRFVGFVGESFEEDSREFISEEVDKDGLYEFKNLPAVGDAMGVSYTLFAIEDGNFKEQWIPHASPLLISGSVARVDAFTYSNSYLISPFFYMGDYNLTVDSDGEVVLNFSDEIDAAKIARIPFTAAGQAFDIAYDGSTVTLTPLKEWSASAGSFTLNYVSDALTSKSGYRLNGSFSITVNVLSVDLSKEKVTVLYRDSLAANGIIPDSSSETALLRWNKVAGAVSYDIFVKYDGKNDYEFLTNVVTDTFRVININGGYAIANKTNTFVVQAKNASSKSSLAGAKELAVFARPTVDFNSGNISKILADSTVNVLNFAYSSVIVGTIEITNPAAAYCYDAGGISVGCASAAAVDCYNVASATVACRIDDDVFEDLSLLDNWLLYQLRQPGSVGNTETYTFEVHFSERMKASTGSADIAHEFNSNNIIGGPAGDGRNRTTITYVWGDGTIFSDKFITVKVAVTTGNVIPSGRSVEEVLSIKGLESRSGNPFFIQYGTALPQYTARELNQIIRTDLEFRVGFDVP